MPLYGPRAFSFSEYFWSPPSPGSLAINSGDTVTIQFSNVSGSGWSFGVQLYNINSGNYTSVKIATPSNPQITFTDMLAGNYRAYVVNNLPGTSWSGNIAILW